MTNADRALDRVHNLYLLQTKLLTSLESDLRDPDARKEVRTAMREFEKLLNVVDWRYMGGMDVFDSLVKLPAEIILKLRTSPVAGSVRKRLAKRTPARAARSAVVRMSRKKKTTKKSKRK
jgi:hypothetical protein